MTSPDWRRPDVPGKAPPLRCSPRPPCWSSPEQCRATQRRVRWSLGRLREAPSARPSSRRGSSPLRDVVWTFGAKRDGSPLYPAPPYGCIINNGATIGNRWKLVGLTDVVGSSYGYRDKTLQ